MLTANATAQPSQASTQARHRLAPLLALWPHLSRYPLMASAALGALLLSAATMLTLPMAARRIIDFGFSEHDQRINQYFGMLIAIGFVLALASATRFYAINWLGERVVANLRAQAFKHLTSLGPTFFEREHSGEVMSRLTADTTQIRGAASVALSQALRNLIMLIGALVMMFMTNAKLSALALAAIPAVVIPLIACGRAVRRLARAAQERLAEASAYAADNLGAVRTMHAFGQETTVAERFATRVERAFQTARAQLLARAGRVDGLRQIVLLVTSANGSARGLYESLGFRVFGTEPDALCIDGVFHDADMMVRFV